MTNFQNSLCKRVSYSPISPPLRRDARIVANQQKKNRQYALAVLSFPSLDFKLSPAFVAAPLAHNMPINVFTDLVAYGGTGKEACKCSSQTASD